MYTIRAGILACLDGYMNIAMEQTEEYVNGQLKNKYGDAFIRGNNGILQSCLLVCNVVHIHMLYDAAHMCHQLRPENFPSLFAVLYISTSKRTLAEGA